MTHETIPHFSLTLRSYHLSDDWHLSISLTFTTFMAWKPMHVYIYSNYFYCFAWFYALDFRLIILRGYTLDDFLFSYCWISLVGASIVIHVVLTHQKAKPQEGIINNVVLKTKIFNQFPWIMLLKLKSSINCPESWGAGIKLWPNAFSSRQN